MGTDHSAMAHGFATPTSSPARCFTTYQAINPNNPSKMQEAVPRLRKTEPGVVDNSSDEPSNITPAVPSSVIWTLLYFTFAMVTLPLGSYFFSVRYVFNGNTTYAGALAALMANVVLITYVVLAFKDDQAEQQEEQEKKKKSL
ncbi:hypothetical protein CC80DRAFT_296780 [Byssothecium circinans]|uniref:Uncharacterized protein n=1 Tax=Byssothecium circinans TaxID=147558 RepID=A0A6A5TIQ0_9PLEO|nr:hypothetical protein CC80DRAFT_296780 [Byssothecium circinans]